MLSLLGFLIMLGPLVIVHEFGHYIFAKIFGVKAEIFSVGFGPKVFSRQCGETEVRISAIPLGGYVKLLGEEREAELKPEDKPRALHAQAAWKRFFIFFGGPLFNFVWAIVVFMVMMALGEQQIASVVGRVLPGSVASQIGFQPNDKILAVEGKPVRTFEDVQLEILNHPDQKIRFDLAQNSGTRTLLVPTSAESGYSEYGEETKVGRVEGLLRDGRGTLIGISNSKSIAGLAGVKTGDQILEINGTPIKSWEEVEALFEKAGAGAVFQFKTGKTGVQSPTDAHAFAYTKGQNARSLGEETGLYSSELFVDSTPAKSPAEVAGVKAGDRLAAVGKTEIRSFFELRETIQKAGETEGKVSLTWERDGQRITQQMVPTATSQRDPLLNKKTQYTIGVFPKVSFAEPVFIIERVLNPFKLLYRSTARVADFTQKNFTVIRKMIVGDVSVATLGGPIMIGKIAGESLAHGINAFLGTMAILSIGLGVLNILPVPVLDGGHLMLLGIEAIRRKPLTIRQMEVIQQVGLSLILLLMIVVIRNDLARLPFFQ
ncbi:RIP metalloprotease RseP [Bdellovibrionota bacterium FG-2]